MAVKYGRETQDYAAALLAEVQIHAEFEGQEAFLAEAFTDLVLGDLDEEGFWPDYQLSYFVSKGMEISAWGIDEASRTLYLAVTHFEYSNEAASIAPSRVETIFGRLAKFFTRARSGKVDAQDHNPVVDVATTIESAEDFDTVRFTLLTNRISSSADAVELVLADVPVVQRVWDLESIRRLRQTGEQLEPIEVDFVSRFGSGVPCLKAPKATSEVEALLLFVPGNYLADIYLEFGPRLLERNVRSFLMARGKINQGIRDTLRTEPQRFLAYNNGLTATASKVEMVSTLEGGPSIARVMDLQIVNGGQTTASIATAARDPQVDMENVCVQMKLVVVKPELLDELVPNISRFANRQNAVQESDLAANNDYLRQLQIVSRTEWTPSSSSGRASKWYFERARGSYAVEKAEAGTPSQQAIFLSNYPTNQHFGKNELAIYENTWARLPQFVCRGGQKNFAEFVDRLTEIPTGDDSGAEEYRRIFRNLVSKAILFKSADKLIYKSLGGTYKRAVVTYTVSYLIEHSAIGPDLDQIWRTQKIESQVESAIVEIAGPLKDFLILSAAGRNITEWAKNKDCWEAIRGESFPFSDPFTQSAGSPSAGPTPSDGAADTERRSANTGEVGMSLADAIEAVLGERIEGDWKSYRRRKWTYLGNSGIPTPSGRDSYHLFEATFLDSDKIPYDLTVAVDFPLRSIKPIDRLPDRDQVLIQQWLSPADNGETEPHGLED